MSRIGIDLRMMGTQHGGIGRYISELVPRVVEKAAGEYFILFPRTDSGWEKQLGGLRNNPNVTVVPVQARHYSLAEQTSFLKLLNKSKLDLAHFPNFNFPIFYRGKFVVTIHDVIHHKLGGAKKSHLLHFLAYKKVIRQAAHLSQYVITVSESAKQDIIQTLQVPTEKVNVIYEGPSLEGEIDSSLVEQVKERFYLRRPYFLFVGVLERKKNIINLTRGFDEFIKKAKLDMDLVIAGKADKHYPEIRYKAMDIANKNRLVFTDYVSETELRALYKGAYAFVSASLYEGFGLPGVEAMQFNLPLVASNIPVFNEIYDNAAIYFNPLDTADIAEKLTLLATDQGLYSQLQMNAVNRKSLFDWEQTADKTWKVYQQALKFHL